MQVKFRGKRVDIQGWVEGNLIIADSISGEDYYIRLQNWDDVHGYLTYPVIPESVGMFTGLTDKNGKEIYGAVGEKGGDIMKLEPLWFIEEDVERIEVVVWDKEMSRFTIGRKTNIYPNSNWEIIGNAFDNHELLEK